MFLHNRRGQPPDERGDQETIQDLGLFPYFISANTVQRLDSGTSANYSNTDFLIDFSGHSCVAYTFYDPTSLITQQYYYSWYEENIPAFSISDKNNLLYVYPLATLPRFKVFCDGCEPGDCKASKSKYPGYVCLDCAELSDRLKRIGHKLDGENR